MLLDMGPPAAAQPTHRPDMTLRRSPLMMSKATVATPRPAGKAAAPGAARADARAPPGGRERRSRVRSLLAHVRKGGPCRSSPPTTASPCTTRTRAKAGSLVLIHGWTFNGEVFR